MGRGKSWLINLGELEQLAENPAPGVFYKPAEGRTSNHKHLSSGKLVEYSCIEAEYHAARRINSLTSTFVKPYNLKKENGEPVGYFMEDLTSTGMDVEILNRHTDSARTSRLDIDPSKVEEQLWDFYNILERNNEPHGDLNSWNVYVYEDSSIRIFDPVGYPEDFPEAEGELQKDRWNVEEIIENLETSSSSNSDDRQISSPDNRLKRIPW